MESRKIPDTSIKASSQRAQHPAHHGRLGEDNYWCSEEGKDHFIEIDLSKKYKITGARIQLKSEYKIRSIILQGKILNEWENFHYEKVLLSLPFVEKRNYIVLCALTRKKGNQNNQTFVLNFSNFQCDFFQLLVKNSNSCSNS